MRSYVLVDVLLRMSSKEIRGRNYMDKIETNVISVTFENHLILYKTKSTAIAIECVLPTSSSYGKVSVKDQWSRKAKVCDRLFFRVFLSYFVCCTKDMKKQTP